MNERARRNQVSSYLPFDRNNAKEDIRNFIDTFFEGSLHDVSEGIPGVSFYGRTAVPFLMELLHSSDEQAVAASAATLRDIGQEAAEAVPLLTECFYRSDNNHIRLYSAQALSRIDSSPFPPAEEIIGELIGQLQDSDERIRLDAARALGQFRESAKEVIPELLRIIGGEETEVAAVAIDSLSLIEQKNEQAIPVLVKALSRPEKTQEESEELSATISFLIKSNAASALSKIGSIAVPPLIPLLSSEYDDDIRFWAAFTLGHIGTDDREVIDSLLSFLESNQSELIQLVGAATLAALGAETEKILPVLISRLKAERQEIRAITADAIGKIGPAAMAAAPYLIEALKDDGGAVRRQAALALSKMGPEVARELKQLLTSESTGFRSSETRQGAIYALGIANKPSEELLSLFEQIVADGRRDMDERRIAASALNLADRDVSWFFTKKNLVRPQNAICPLSINQNKATFDVSQNSCSSPSLWGVGDWLCEILGCKK